MAAVEVALLLLVSLAEAAVFLLKMSLEEGISGKKAIAGSNPGD